MFLHLSRISLVDTHQVRYIYVRKTYQRNWYLPGFRNLKESDDDIFVLNNIIKAYYLELDTFRLLSESAQDKLAGDATDIFLLVISLQ